MKDKKNKSEIGTMNDGEFEPLDTKDYVPMGFVPKLDKGELSYFLNDVCGMF